MTFIKKITAGLFLVVLAISGMKLTAQTTASGSIKIMPLKSVVAGKTGGYALTKTYTDLIESKQKANAIENGKHYHYVYVWVPKKSEELGVAVISPAPSGAKAINSSMEFDPYISLSSSDIKNTDELQQVINGTKKVIWKLNGENGDNKELPVQANEQHSNALYRTTDVQPGLYRVAIADQAGKPTTGSYQLIIMSQPVDGLGEANLYFEKDLTRLSKLIR